MAELTVTRCSHHFTVTRITPRARPAVESYAKKFVQYGWERSGLKDYKFLALRVYAAATADRTEFRFHINQLKDFYPHLELHFLTGDLVQYVDIAPPTPVQVVLPILPQWKDHDYQVPVIQYLESPEPPVQKFVDLQTGKGKSYCTMRAMSDIGYRAIIIVKPMYLEKWLEDLLRTYDITLKDTLTVRGGAQLMRLLEMGKDGDLDTKIILLSNKTMQNWIKLYEKFKDDTLEMGYACTPDRFCETLGVGIRIIDEVHQDFHLNFKIDLYTNVQRSASLSATLLSDDDFINRMYEVAYPAHTRYQGPAYDKYIAAKAVIYRLVHPNKIRFKDQVSKNYSHHIFEQSVLRNPQLAQNYFGLIDQCIRGSYLVDYKPTQKLIIFCASIDMCTKLVAYLKQKHPLKDVRRYVEEDPYDDLMDADIRVTTLQSAGTAVDIPNLTTTILTVALASSQGNVQGFGPLRKLKDGTTPQFLYFVCEDIPKHLDYHERKRVILQDRAISYKSVFINNPL